MADEEEKKENEEGAADAGEEASPKKGKKKSLFLGGGMVALIALAYVLSMMAVPKAPEATPFGGPYVIVLTAEDIHVNLAGDGAKRYLAMMVKAEYDGYDEVYAAARVADPLYQAKLKDLLISLGRQKRKEDIEDALGEEAFKEEMRESVDPLLFPIHVGNELSHAQADELSGLRPGSSSRFATMRGGFKSHKLLVDAENKTIALDGGEAVSFEGNEVNLEIQNENQLNVFVDVTGLNPEFSGEVAVGTFGHLRDVLFDKFIVQ